MQLSKLSSDCLLALGTVDGRSRLTIEQYDLVHRQFIEYLHSRGVDDDVRQFTSDNVIGFVGYLTEHGIPARTILGKLSALSSRAEFAIRHPRYRLAANPVKAFRWPTTKTCRSRRTWRR